MQKEGIRYVPINKEKKIKREFLSHSFSKYFDLCQFKETQRG